MERMKAHYGLGHYRANFNFLEFLVASASQGANHVVFSTDKPRPYYSPEETERRVKSILEPACALAGCTFSHGNEPGINPGYHISAVINAHKNGRIRKLKTVLPPKSEKYTVTLRNTSENANRNSNEDDWREFAQEIGAFVIEDWSDKPIHLHERMAYYAGAKMNYFVANGPMMLCLLSDYPYTAFMDGVNEKYHQRNGFWRIQLPWANKNQKAVWNGASPKNMRRYSPTALGLN